MFSATNSIFFYNNGGFLVWERSWLEKRQRQLRVDRATDDKIQRICGMMTGSMVDMIKLTLKSRGASLRSNPPVQQEDCGRADSVFRNKLVVPFGRWKRLAGRFESFGEGQVTRSETSGCAILRIFVESPLRLMVINLVKLWRPHMTWASKMQLFGKGKCPYFTKT